MLVDLVMFFYENKNNDMIYDIIHLWKSENRMSGTNQN